MTAAFSESRARGCFARCPGSTWVGESEKYPLGLRSHPRAEPDPAGGAGCSTSGSAARWWKHAPAARRAAGLQHPALRRRGTGKSATVKALLSSFWLEGLRIVEVAAGAADESADDFLHPARAAGEIHRFVDDLAFNDSCPEYTALKTVLRAARGAPVERRGLRDEQPPQHCAPALPNGRTT